MSANADYPGRKVPMAWPGTRGNPMTPETPDPPPVQCAACRSIGPTAACNLCPTGVHPYRPSGAPPVPPDPWDSVHEEFADMSQWETARVYRADPVDAARAADALRHQQETADLTRAVQGNALAVVKASAEGGSQIADLRAALSTAEATIASLTAQVTALETELDETSAFIARATTGPDSPLNLAVDVEARAVKAEQERDAAQQESKRWEVHYNEKLLAEMEEFERAERAGKEAQTLREALAKADEALKRLMADQHDCGDPGTECPMHDAHKSWHPVSEALTLIAALAPRPQEPQPRAPGCDDRLAPLQPTDVVVAIGRPQEQEPQP